MKKQLLMMMTTVAISALPVTAASAAQDTQSVVEQAAQKPYPRAFSHIGISVPDLEKAVEFYSEVLGWYTIMEPTKVKEDNSAIGKMSTDVFSEGWGSYKIAHMSTSDKVGIELFEFEQQKNPDNNFKYWETGVFHFAVQDPNVEELAQKIVDAGGKRRMDKPRFYYPGEKPYRMIYMEDPFGNIIEIYSHSYELHYASGAYQ